MGQALEVPVRAEWSEIDRVREAANGFLCEHGLATDVTDAIGMVVGELLENANKYGCFAEAELIFVRVTVQRAAIVVEVQNPTAAETLAHLHRLDRAVQWIRSFQDPFEAYVERVKEVSSQDLYSHESGLGLVRIAYEAHAIVDFFLDRERRLTVSAVYPLS